MKKLLMFICLLPMLGFAQQTRITSIAAPSSSGSSSSVTAGDILWGTNTVSGGMTNIFGNVIINTGGGISQGSANWVLGSDGAFSAASGLFDLTPSGVTTFGGNVNVTSSGLITGNGSGITNAWVRTIIHGGYSPVALASGNNFAYLAGVHSTVTATVDQRINIGGMSGGYLSNFVVMRTNTPSAGTNIAYKIMHNTSAAGASAITALTNTALVVTQFGNFAAFATNTSTESFSVPTSKYNYFTVNAIANTALVAHPYSWTVEWWHQTP